MKKDSLMMTALACLLASCSGVAPTDLEKKTGADAGKTESTTPGHGDSSSIALSAFRNPNRANLQFTYDITVYADKIEFLDSIHSECLATGHVWLKCSHPIEGLKEMFGEKAEINMFAQTLKMSGRPQALMTGNQVSATSDSAYFVVDRGEGGAFLKMIGPNRTVATGAE